jgi:hypothetical protein
LPRRFCLAALLEIMQRDLPVQQKPVLWPYDFNQASLTFYGLIHGGYYMKKFKEYKDNYIYL